MNNVTLIFHHDDNDGKAAAAIVLNSVYNSGTGSCTLVECNYTKTLEEYVNSVNDWANCKNLYIVDYSLSTDADLQFLYTLYTTLGDRLIWIDHHKTSMEKLNSPLYDDLKEIPGLRINGISGCGLTWVYMLTKYILVGNSSIQEKLSSVFIDPVYSEYLSMYNNTERVVSPKTAISILKNTNCPLFIQYIHRYDIWDTDDKVIYFKYGFGEQGPYDIEHIITTYGGDEQNYVEDIISTGKLIYDNIMSENKNHVTENGFEVSVVYGDIIYNALALNTNRFSSLTFGDSIKEYDLVIPFSFDGQRWRYSMYTEKDDVDVSVLCTVMGGGGHKKASGFSSDRFIFEKHEEQSKYIINIF